jgi:hypothetical protein
VCRHPLLRLDLDLFPLLGTEESEPSRSSLLNSHAAARRSIPLPILILLKHVRLTIPEEYRPPDPANADDPRK